MEIQILRMNEARRTDFYRVHCRENDTEWCNCVAWWLPTWEGWGERTEEQNRALRDELFDHGNFDGYLLYVEGYPVGWCQCGPRDRLPKLCKAYKLEPDPATWAITCFVIAPEHRDHGLTHRLLEGVLQDLERQGVRYVQGFPRRGRDKDKGEIWTGPESAFQRAGFTLERDHKNIPVYGKRLRKD